VNTVLSKLGLFLISCNFLKWFELKDKIITTKRIHCAFSQKL